MRKKLLRAYWLGNVLTLLIVTAFAAITIATDIDADRGSLMAILNTASAWTSEASSNLQELADKIAHSAPPLRVTFLMPNGIILADSGDDIQDGSRLVAQEEVLEALRAGVGDSFSLERGVFYPALRAALLMEGRLLLHLDRPYREFEYLLTIYLPLLLLISLAMVVVARWLMNPLTSKMVHQLEQVRDLLEGTLVRETIDPDAFFPELRPAMENIIYLIDRMRFDLEQISKTRDMQRDFVDNSSHELKSPLTSISGFAEMLLEDPDLSKQEREEYLGYILKECERMAGIINDILMLERQSQALGPPHETVSLDKVANQVAVALSPQAAARDISIQIKGKMQVHAVEQDMWELLRNLMSNAVRYGRQGGWVLVEMDGKCLKVSDNGIGIAPEHLPRIYEKFYRVDSARARESGGTGLGLAIVASITNRYNAALSVDSKPGEGTCFSVQFVRDL
ncbi:MAG: sensor histidine kinase [Christensenellales bacterium]|jgi:two-component system phosphate regulon sensor histidine kinase PhoR